MATRVGRVTKCHRGKSRKKNMTKIKFYNYKNMDHFAWDCSELKKVQPYSDPLIGIYAHTFCYSYYL